MIEFTDMQALNAQLAHLAGIVRDPVDQTASMTDSEPVFGTFKRRNKHCGDLFAEDEDKYVEMLTVLSRTVLILTGKCSECYVPSL